LDFHLINWPVIPSSVGELNKLVLELYMNRLSGELPAQIGKLKHLETLAV
jgi:hypothetical protein